MPLAGYSGTPLVKKLGIAPGMTVALIGAPPNFRKELVGLPEDVRLVTRSRPEPDLTVWFVDSRRELDARIAQRGRSMGRGLWIAWPKKASGVRTDVVEDLVRAAGLANGLVDYKVCAINQTWSGLKFAKAKANPKISKSVNL